MLKTDSRPQETNSKPDNKFCEHSSKVNNLSASTLAVRKIIKYLMHDLFSICVPNKHRSLSSNSDYQF